MSGLWVVIAELEQSGPDAGLQQRLDGLEAGAEITELPALEQPRLRDGKQSDGGLRDHPEAAFGADKQAVQPRTRRGFLHGARDNHLAAGQHGLQPQYLIPHGAVLAAEVSEAVGGDRAADRRHRQRPGIVPAHQAVRSGRGVHGCERRPGARLRHAIRGSDAHLRHAPQIEHHGRRCRCCTAHQTAAAAQRDHRHPVPVGQPQHCLHLRRAKGFHDAEGPSRRGSGGQSRGVQRIACHHGQQRLVGAHTGRAEPRSQGFKHATRARGQFGVRHGNSFPHRLRPLTPLLVEPSGYEYILGFVKSTRELRSEGHEGD